MTSNDYDVVLSGIVDHDNKGFKTVAVDFNGVLYHSKNKKDFVINVALMHSLAHFKKEGNKVILWTCRDDEWYTPMMLRTCRMYGLQFDAINENLPDVQKLIKDNEYGKEGRKIYADAYIDDRAIVVDFNLLEDNDMNNVEPKQPKQAIKEKIMVTSANVIVTDHNNGKPYYEIKYQEVGENTYNVGYGSYEFGNVIGWLKECFEIVMEQPAEPKEEEDVVNEPPHYQHGTYEVIDEMIIMFGYEKTINFCELNSWKYRARAPFKGKMEQDMDKANRYLEMAHELKRMQARYGEESAASHLLKKKEEKGNGRSRRY